MSLLKSKEILERVYVDHINTLVGWALKKCKSKEDAEDLCHEIMAQFYNLIITKENQGEEIKKIDAFLWKVAYSVMADYYREHERKDKLTEEIENDLYEEQQTSLETDQEDNSDIVILLEKLRKSISQLEYNHRESMIMFYLEKKSLADISKKLEVTENYVKKLIYESRQKIKENDKNHIYDVENKYRPNSLMMSFSGEKHISPDFIHISQCLSKQNICLACYERACSIEDLTHLLGLPCAYIEFDIKWLEEKGFIKKIANKYTTTFFIFDGTFNTRLANIFMKHKSKCLDKIVSKLTALQDKVKAINFTGSDKPINELLWFLIYTFTDLASVRTCYEEFGGQFEPLLRTDGGQYYPIGIFNIDSKVPLDTQFSHKYKGIKKWECNGTCSLEDGNNKVSWLGLRDVGIDLHTNLSTLSPVIDVLDCKEILFRAIHTHLKIDSLSETERDILTRCIDKGILSIVGQNKQVSPNFYVFTPSQRQELENLLLECFNEMKPKFSNLYKDIRKMCKECLPRQLEGYLDFITYLSLSFSHFYTTGFAFLDELLAIPDNSNDYTTLTLIITASDKPKKSIHKDAVKIKINFT